jgi:peptidyl-dipeptidase Dcp
MTGMINAQNPFMGKFNTPHETIPFNKIRITDYEPAIREGIRLHDIEMEAIINSKNAPTFENTIETLDESGQLLDRVTSVFGNILGTDTSDELQALAMKMMPLLSEHSNNISLNPKLFKRVKAIYDNRKNLKLNTEQAKLLKDTYIGFIRSGANLEGKDKEEYRKITAELSQLSLTFGQNCLKDNNDYQLVLTDKSQIAGLAESALETAAETAKEKNVKGYVFTLKAPSYSAFMKYADNRDLRKQMYIAYNTQGAHDNANCNLELVKKLVNDRLAIAKLLGYNDFASYVLEERMAQNETNVYKLLNELLKAYTPTSKKEMIEVENFAKASQGSDFKLMPWDWSYYSNKLKEKKYNLDMEVLRPYFELDKVKEGVFGLATRLYGITFKRNTDIPVYQKDVEAYEVYDKDGKYLAILYLDFFPREGKQAGAWTSSFKEQWKDPKTGTDSRPQVLISTNFTKPTATKPALLTFYELTTILHEFGHSLHAMFSNVTYKTLSGTNVYWDFVELPSQIMENFAIEKDFLHTFAKHYQTGELLPDSLIQSIVDADNFNIANDCLRQLGFGFIDMSWYTRKTPFEGDVIKYEKDAEQPTRLLPGVPNTCMSTQFTHIFTGGYAGGYYSYKWAEVLAADAFSLFKQKGIFNPEVAQSFRDNILSRGGTELPMILYKRFRGQEPTIDALLIKNGIKK